MHSSELEIMPQGVLGVYSDQARPTNANEAGSADKERLITFRNSPGELKDMTDPNYDRNILWESVMDGDQVVGATQTLWPTQPWGWGSVMVNAIPAELLGPTEEVPQDHQGRLPVQFVYDSSREAQVSYARHILGGIHTVSVVPLLGEVVHDGLPAAVAIENTVQLLGDGRTLATQHAQIRKTGMPVSENVNARFATSLLAEQRLKRDFPEADEYVQDVANGMRSWLNETGNQGLADALVIYPRQGVKPYGYTARTSITSDMPLDQQAAQYASIMKSHFRTGGTRLTEYLGSLRSELSPRTRSRLHPQYSFRQYTYFKPEAQDRSIGRLHVTWSPEIFGGAALEDSGVLLQRGPQFQPPFDSSSLTRYQADVRDVLHLNASQNTRAADAFRSPVSVGRGR